MIAPNQVAPNQVTLDRVTLAHGGVPAVTDLTGRFASGSMTAVVGPNGAGKTTLLRAIAGLHRPAAGTITCGARVALLPQAAAIERGFPISGRDFVALGAYAAAGALRAIPPDAARAALDRVGLAALSDRPIGALSAGQFQRLAFARLIVQDAPILLLDEPFTAIDAATEAVLIDLLGEWHAQGRTIVAVLHDLDLVARAFPSTLLLARRAIAWGATAATLSAANRAALAARSSIDGPWADRDAA